MEERVRPERGIPRPVEDKTVQARIRETGIEAFIQNAIK
jgi:hypothetical protein